MIKILKNELEEKIRNPKKSKVVSIKTTHENLIDNFDKFYITIAQIIDKNSSFFSSYDISKSVDDDTMAPIIHITFFP